MKKWLCLGLLAVFVVSGCTGSGGELPTAPPVSGTPAGPPPEPSNKATKRQSAGVIDQRGLVE